MASPMAPAGPSPQRLSLGLSLAFAATSLPLSALGIAVSVHLPAYFAASLGVELAVVGAAFALARAIDVPIEPALGLAMDRTTTRWGRYRVWTLLGAPFLMAGLFLLLQADSSVGTGGLVAFLLVMYLGSSMLLLSHSAWASTLAASYNDRARLFGVITAVGVAGAVSVLLFPIVMEQLGYTDAQAIRAMIWYLIALAPLAVLLVIWRTPERVMRDAPGARFRLRDYVELVFDRNMFRVIVADLALGLGPGWMAALYLFYSRDYMGFTSGQANILLLIYIVAGIAGAPSLAWVATRIGKHRAVIASAILYSLLLVSLPLLPKGVLLASAPTLFFTGFFAASFNVLTRAMTADVADEMRLRQGKERGGLLYALTTLTNKVAAGVGIALTFWVLGQTGYDPQLGDRNTPEAVRSLMLVFVAGPIVFVSLGALVLLGYGLTPARAAETRRQLDAREAAMLAGAGVESLTGEEAPPPRRD
ncbi:MAG: MFS transporter [Phenylobacterium sp.]|uniref:MFS transporter n=1 Tax=Phenylobacterium sp. TaxID=1871053 RepID=UPI001A44B181|nr:MFS transporter [Phenylobacterium sp.]MBL8773960.1 MFS transporter [Phenylobacterium sp.]